MLQPTGALRWSKQDLAQLRAEQKARIDAAAQQARAASVIDLDEVRRSGRVRDFCAALPKGGMLHVHPTGTLQPATVERLLREENPVVGRDAISYAKAFGAAELQFLRDYPGDVRYLALRPEDQARFRGLFVLPENRSDFRRFAVIFPLVGWLRQLPNVDAWQIITDDFLARAEAQRVRYAEWTMHVEPNAEALRQLQTTAARAQERYGITVRVNAAFDRATSPRDNAGKLQQLIRSLNEKPSGVLVGIDLAGDEAGQPAFEAGQPLYSQLLRDAPLHRTMHAGTGDPRNARDALLLGAERIGHGTQLLADPVVLEFAARQRVAVEANLVSNVRLRYAESFARHPFLPLVRSGVRVSLSTDDEGIFGTDITNEFATAIAHTDITYAEVRQLIINSIATSFAAPEEKDALLALVENDLREFEQSWGTSGARD
jgi:adenosine deaminase